MQKVRRPHKQARQLIMREKGCYISILSVKQITCTQLEIRHLFKIEVSSFCIFVDHTQRSRITWIKIRLNLVRNPDRNRTRSSVIFE